MPNVSLEKTKGPPLKTIRNNPVVMRFFKTTLAIVMILGWAFFFLCWWMGFVYNWTAFFGYLIGLSVDREKPYGAIFAWVLFLLSLSAAIMWLAMRERWYEILKNKDASSQTSK